MLFRARLSRPSRTQSFRPALSAGNRLRLILSNQHWPILWPSPTVPTFMIDSGSCSLLLPLLEPSAADIAPTFSPAEIATPVQIIELNGETHRRDIAVDVGARRETLTLLSDFGSQQLTNRSIITSARVNDRMEITEGDPLSARLDTGWVLGFKSGDADVETRSSVTLTSDAERFYLAWHLQAYERGVLTFEREGGEWFDRDHL